MPNSPINGGCFCKSVRYQIESAPIGSMICHCESCRRVSGAPATAWITVRRDSFKILQGALSDLRSSLPVTRTFCSRCGTHITYTHTKDPDSIDIATCTLDDANGFPPTHHSWLEDDLSWVKFGDGLPTFPKSRY